MCGIAFIRLKKPLEYFKEKYGSALWGLSKMYLLLEKQHNRGQDGAGLASVKLDIPAGVEYLYRERQLGPYPLIKVIQNIESELTNLKNIFPNDWQSATFLKENFSFASEIMLGHLRYGTSGAYSINYTHPVIRSNNWRSRNLAIAGNFNFTNLPEQIEKLIDLGQHPRHNSDTVTLLERIGHFLDVENRNLKKKYESESLSAVEIEQKIAKELDLHKIIKRSSTNWDGGYAIAGIVGNGDSFIFRDPNGIRPVFYCETDEVIAVASERPTLATSFNIDIEQVKKIQPAQCMVIKANGSTSFSDFTEKKKKKSCSFERIYFSRGSDIKIYNERKNLGKQIIPKVLESINFDLENTVFSYIPNTALVSYLGMIKGLEQYSTQNNGPRIRSEHLVIKDAKLRTFITDDSSRDDLVAHVYDITYGALKANQDNLVCIDDSIVRGTTLEKSILAMLSRLNPKKIVIVSSAPQIRYPDCYGIDMSRIEKLVAFKAAINLLKKTKQTHIIEEVYQKCKNAESENSLHKENFVKAIYERFEYEEISKEIANIVKPKENFSIPLEIVYQNIEKLHDSMPNHKGDWYFTGEFPTPGGNAVVNRAFINFYEGKNERAY